MRGSSAAAVGAARCHLSRNNLDRAISLCYRAMEDDPQNPECAAILAECLQQKGEVGESILSRKNAIQLCEENGEFSDAFKMIFLKEKVRAHPAEPQHSRDHALLIFILRLCKIQIDEKLFDEAIGSYEKMGTLFSRFQKEALADRKALGLDVDEMATLFSLHRFAADRYESQNNFDEAVRCLSHAIDLYQIANSPVPAENFNKELLAGIYFSLGKIYAKRRDHDLVIESLKKAVELDPTLTMVFPQIGQAYIEKKMYSEAIGMYEKGLEANPKNAEGCFRIALCHSELSRYDAATFWCRKAIEIDPKNAGAHFVLGKIYYVNGMFENALSHLSQAVQENPDEPDSNFYLGMCHLKKDLHFSAIPYLEKTTQLNPGHIEAWHSLGDSLGKCGNLEGARRCWHKLLQIDPQGPAGSEAKKKLEGN